MKKKVSLFVGLSLLISGLCLFFYCTLGEQPIGPDITDIIDTIPDDSIVVWEDGTMEMYVTPSKVPASYTSTAKVTVRLYNINHNPITGKQVYFSSTHGLIEPGAITDSSGIATVTFTSEPVNAEASVYAWIFDYKKNKVLIRQVVTISGVKLSVFSLKNVLKTTKVPIKVVASDAIGEPIAKKPVVFTGDISATLVTKGDGSVDTVVTRSTQGPVAYAVLCQGLFVMDTIKFWDTIPGGVDTALGIRSLRIFSSKSQLNADNTDFAIITAILVDDKTNNPATGDTVYFQSNYGIIDKFAIVDNTGRAHANLRSTPINGTCYVYARARGNIGDTTSVILSGVKLALSADPVNSQINEYSVVTGLLSDASDKPIEGGNVEFNALNGLFDNNTNKITITTNANGKATTRVTSPSASTVRINASSLNCIDTTTIFFTNNRLTLTASPQSIAIGGNAYSTLEATYRDGNNNLISGQWIKFYTNAGTLLYDSAQTVNGIATNRLYSSYFANKATVQAVAANGTASANVTFYSLSAKSIDLKISPDNIGINGGVATLIATVKDSSGNMVTGADVNFRITKGPGGNEYIDKPVATSKDGIARSQLFAGTLPSQYRACEVAAYIGTIADTTKMTISGAPYIVSVARPQSDTVVVSNVGQVDPATFKFNVGAVVQDVNGNNVADGMEVHFSAVVSGMAVARKRFVRWEVSATEIKPIITYSVMSVPFEDINNNFKMDNNIDLDLDDYPLIASRGDDRDGNGIMDYDIKTWDLFYDFNFNGRSDINECENCYQKTYINQTTGYDTTIKVIGKDTLGFDTTLVNPYVDTLITPRWDSTHIPPIIVYDTSIFIAYDTIVKPKIVPKYDTTITPITQVVDSTCTFFADLNNNGVWDKTELYIDHDSDGVCDMPASGDFAFWRWEMRPQFHGVRFDFQENDFAVVVASSAVTKNGVAEASLVYPRQMALRLIVTINAEINGIRDRDGERFTLPVIIQGKK